MTSTGLSVDIPQSKMKHQTDSAGTMTAQSTPKSTAKEETPSNQPNSRSVHVISAEVEYAGPIPHPEILAGYENTLAGAADRIIKMAEEEQRHRHDQEHRMLESDIRLQRSGMILYFILGLILMVLGFILLYMNRDLSGLASVLNAFAGISAIFAPPGYLVYKTRQDSEAHQGNSSEDNSISSER